VIVLAHNAAMLGVPIDHARLIEESLSGAYMESLALVLEAVRRTREQQAREAESGRH
jgi:hypothetical protein